MSDNSLSEISFGQLPPIMRVLYVSATCDDWLECCLAQDSAVAVKIDTADVTTLMARLRVDNYDCVILHHEPEKLDAIMTLGLIRTVAPGQAIVVLGEQPAERWTALCLEASADAYICNLATEVRTLLWVLARAVERQRLFNESQSLSAKLRLQRSQHHQSALYQLRAQRSLLLEHADGKAQDPHPPSWLVEHFVELLRVYVVSGRGNPRNEVEQLVQRLDKSEVTLPETLMAHTVATETLVLGLGSRPAWHVLSRANLMAYELMMQMSPMFSPAARRQ